MGNQDYIVKKLRHIEILPTFPKIVSEILTLINDPMSSASDLARHMDPSMAGEVLRIANTAYFGTRNFRSITTMERAIAVIGYEHLGYVVLQMPFLALVQGPDTTFDRKLFITHAIVCGSLAEVSMARGKIVEALQVCVHINPFGKLVGKAGRKGALSVLRSRTGRMVVPDPVADGRWQVPQLKKRSPHVPVVN